MGRVCVLVCSVDQLCQRHQRVLAFLQEKGLEAPALLTNGVHTPLAGQSIEQEVMSALNSEVRSVQHLVRTRKITDETADVYSAIANHSATFPRYNKTQEDTEEGARGAARAVRYGG